MSNNTKRKILSKPSKEVDKQNENEAGPSRINLENIDDFTNVCRTCAAVTEFVVPIFIGEGLQNKLADKIHKYLPIQVSEEDVLPQVDENSKINKIINDKKGKLENKLSVSNVKDIIIKIFQIADPDLINSGLEFLCETCDNQFPKLDSFVEHIQSQHNNDCKDITIETFIKENVSIVEMLAEDLTTDIESEKEVNVVKLKRFHCLFCESSFSSPTRLICHLNQHVEVSIEDGVNCCDISYHDTKTFVKHLEKAHVKNSSKKNEANTCRSCGFTAQGKDELKDHITKLHVKEVDVQNKHDDKQRDKWQKYIPAVCPECNKTFSNKYNMLMHMKSHRGVTEKYPCDRCSKTYKSKASLKSHQEIAHKGILSFVCSYCGEAFPSRIARDVHKRIHTGDKPYTCKYCDRSYRAKNTLDRHLEIHLNVRKYECYICSKRFRKSTHLKYHLSESVDVGDESENDDRPLAAIASEKSNDLYKKFYNALVNFRNHYATEHERNTSDYLEFTDSTDSEVIMDDDRGDGRDGDQDINNFDDLTEWNMRKGKMDEETRLELNEVQRKIDGKIFFACKICDKNLSTAHTYIFHKRIHTGERPCVCHVCGKQFRTPNGLQRHLTETHQRLRRHSCSFCPKNFANTQNLKQHLRIHTGERPFVCSHCGKRFTQSGSLHVHLKTHSEQYPFQCAECGAKFRLRSGLSRHRLKHTGERPHVCVHCGKAFRQKHDLHSHALAHTNLKPHVCLVCGAAFRQLRALKHHYKRVHQSEPPKQLLNDSVFDHVGQYQ
ncbi:Zinc finger protein 33A [Papilio machaon]|uniref:Zinc finger protein 33A n=1 Tax=Papilio machaon TaxID=76193 RepID=A0A194RIA8_PAPMA|nr:Zinc finger protein 33A [Papilio machaon]